MQISLKWLFLLLLPMTVFSQNRVFDRPQTAGGSLFLDQAGSQMYIVHEHRFSFDSSHIHFFNTGPDLVLDPIVGIRMLFGATASLLNTGTAIADGVVVGGANLGFNTRPYILRINDDGTIPYCSTFTNLMDGQDQIHTLSTNGTQLDLFTWADNPRPSFYMLNGNIDGNFPSGLRIHAPGGTEFRVDEAVPSSSAGEHVVICQAEPNGDQSQFLVVLEMDNAGVNWSVIHDHTDLSEPELEQVIGLQRLSDGNWIYTALFWDTSLQNRLVKMDDQGAILWAKEYFVGSQKLRLFWTYETSDGGLLLTANNPDNQDRLVLKLDANGALQWAQRFELNNISTFPLGSFLKSDQGQLYGFNHLAIAEMDEDVNVCDMVPFSGITAADATVEVSNISLTTTPIAPEMAPLLYELRSSNFANEQSCVFTDTETPVGNTQLSLFPNPVNDVLNVDLRQTTGTVDIRLYDLRGQLVFSERRPGGQIQMLDVAALPTASYWVVVVTEQGLVRDIVVKEMNGD